VIISPFLLVAWLLLGFLSFGPAVFIFYSMRKSSKKLWPTKVEQNYKPKISIILPTYNEASIIALKLTNLGRVRYDKNLVEIIMIDSNSSDGTVETAKQFLANEPQGNLRILTESDRRGKSNALNYALGFCTGDVVIISDADCFWPSDILEKAIPFLADPTVGAIYCPKILLNSNQTWITRSEEAFLRSANILRLGESKSGSTVFFEGGFSSFKKEAFDKFDVYETGSDDCGTVVSVIENNFRAMQVPEVEFFTTFPASYRGKIAVKSRRSNQLVRVFGKCLDLLIRKRIRLARAKRTIIPNVLLYLLSPITFFAFIISTLFLLASFPYLLAAFVFLLVPSVRFYLYEFVESNILLFASIFAVCFGKRFSVWPQPEDRMWLKPEVLSQYNLI